VPENDSALSDDQLVDRVRSGSAKAVEALFARYERPLLAFCRHMLGRRDRGEEAVRESFAQALGAVRMHERPVNIRALLFAMARNRCLANLTLEGASSELELDGLDRRVASDAALRRLAAAVGALPADQRAALLLAEIGVHAEEEIGTIVGAPRDKVATLVGQARMTVAGVEKPGDWHCAHAVAELAGHDGLPRREAVRRHLEDCESCQAFCATVEQQRRLLKVALPVARSEALRAPAPAAGVPRPARRRPAPDAAPARRDWRTKAALAGIAALLAGVGVVAAGHGQGTATPAALAPVGAARTTDVGSSAGAAGATGDAGAVHDADLRDADGAGPLARAVATAQDIVDRS
jgi:DNA-directed RNA polymerase specialized sigma24 family protein